VQRQKGKQTGVHELTAESSHWRRPFLLWCVRQGISSNTKEVTEPFYKGRIKNNLASVVNIW